MKSIKNFIKETELKHLSERPNVNPEDFFKAVYNGTTEGKEHIKVNTSTGYAALSFKGLGYMKKGSFVEEAYLNWLNTNTIWSQLRTVHGCYGAHIIPNLVAGKVQFGTYRDPNPVTSNEELLQCLEEGANTKFTEDEVEKLAISAYGDKTQPKSISGKALYFFNRTLSALDDQDRIDNINGILKLTPYDIKGIAKYINKQAKESSSVEAFFVKDVPEGFANKTIEC
jgi:Zn-dependent M16 (insulinase) family peptidase